MQNPEDLIRKLLAMAKGGTENEAAVAAEKASILALKYGIDLLKLQTKPEDYIDNLMSDSTKKEQWVSNIVYGLALVNAVKHYVAPQRDGTIKYRLIGKPHAVRTVQLLAEYLTIEVKRQNTKYVKQKSHLDNPEERGAYRKAFRLAASQRLLHRLEEKYEDLRKKDQPNVIGCTALVVADYFDQTKAEIDDFMQDKGLELTYKKPRGISTKSSEGRRDGDLAGQKISLNDQVDNGVHNQRLART